jgi:hypothetical protein
MGIRQLEPIIKDIEDQSIEQLNTTLLLARVGNLLEICSLASEELKHELVY